MLFKYISILVISLILIPILTLNLSAQNTITDRHYSNLFSPLVNAQNTEQLNDSTKQSSPKINLSKEYLSKYDDRYCYRYSWLVDYYSKEKNSNKEKIATKKEIKYNKIIKKNILKKNLGELQKTPDLIAFYPNYEGHLSMTTEALEAIVIEEKKELENETNQLQFTQKAIIEIGDSNKHMDMGESFLLSAEFTVSCIHFSNEQFHDGSIRLIDLKKRIVDILSNDKPNGQEARYFLGAALHTLQDFYAHTNWVELGFTEEIDTRLGRQIISNPPADMYISPEITDAEILDLYIQFQSDDSFPVKIDRYKDKKSLNYQQEYENNSEFRQLAYKIAAAKSDKAGQLLPKFIGSKDKNLLTSGYFMGVGTISSCTVPYRKIRHGIDFFDCEEGIAKDGDQKVNYPPARYLAILATQDYVNQILEHPKIKENVEAIKTLMGIRIIEN